MAGTKTINPKKLLKKGNVTTKKEKKVRSATKKSVQSQVKKPKISKTQANNLLKEQIKKVRKQDLKKVYTKRSEIVEISKAAGPLEKFVEDIKLMISLISDYWNGKYTEIPYYFIAAVVAALLYVIIPFDLIPDFLPVIGYVDDAAVVAACLRLANEELKKYKKWKNRQKK